MIKHLVVNGCSWTAGNELECDPKFQHLIESMGLRKENPSDPFNWNLLDENDQPVMTFDMLYDHFNWPGQLKQKLAAEKLTNLAIGAASNSRIVRTTIDFVKNLTAADKEGLLLIVAWSLSERDEIYLGDAWQRWNSTQPFSLTVDRQTFNDEERIKKIDRLQQEFIVYLKSDYAAVYKYFQQIYLLSNLLDNLNINYMFFNALPAWWDGGDLAVDFSVPDKFQESINWANSHPRFMPQDHTMYRFVDDNKFEVAPYKHPLVDSHAAWARVLFDELCERQII